MTWCEAVSMKVRHVRGFGGVHEHLAVGAQSHALRLDSDFDFAEPGPPRDVDDRDGVVVLVRHVEDVAGGVRDEQFGVGAWRQRIDDPVAGGIDHLDGVVVTDRHEDVFLILGESDAARPLADLDGFEHLPRGGIDHGDRVALLVRNISLVGAGLDRRCERKADAKDQAATQCPIGKTPCPIIGMAATR
jgi:hypothetical protein